MDKKIKDIYGYELIENPETNLLKRVNVILQKTPNQLSADDVCLLVRQEHFLDIVIPKAVDLLIRDPSYGDNYSFSLLSNLSDITEFPAQFKEQLSKLVSILQKSFDKIEFEEEEDRSLFVSSLDKLKRKLS